MLDTYLVNSQKSAVLSAAIFLLRHVMYAYVRHAIVTTSGRFFRPFAAVVIM